MKRFYRIEYGDGPRYVMEENGTAGVRRLVDGDLFNGYSIGAPLQSRRYRVLPPVVPSKIVAVGLNYKDHAAERNKPLPLEPLIFLKPSTAVIGPEDPIVIPDGAGRIDHEAEVGVVIGRRASHVREEDAPAYVFGLTCLNDVTARELQQRDGQFTRAKGFDSFAPIGPCIAAGLDYHASDGIRVSAAVNGTIRQSSSTKELIFPIDRLVAFISSVMTLLPGDVIATGTPAGIAPLQPGDRVTITVQGVGELSNPVVARS
jgi:2-keto-4-pentenoate hydratase/2-oxohepta-3-ene-1,7-dioic acid hydratase in catechol pathway